MNTFLAIFIGYWAFCFFFGGFYLGVMAWVMGHAGIQNSTEPNSSKNNKLKWQLNILFLTMILIGMAIGYYLWGWARFYWNLV